MKRVTALAALLLALAPGLVAASEWRIAPQELARIGEGARLDGDTTIIRQALVPLRMYVLQGDITDTEGKRLAAAGSEVFAAEVEGRALYCTLDTRNLLTLRRLLMRNRAQLLNQTCFGDSDGDGTIDRFWLAQAGAEVRTDGLAAERGSALPPFPIARLTPEGAGADDWVEIRYVGGGKHIDEPAKFAVRYRFAGRTTEVPEIQSARTVGDIQVLSLLGAQITVKRAQSRRLYAFVKYPMSGDFGVDVTFAKDD